MKYSYYILKRKLEAIFIAQFVFIGRIVHLVLGDKNNYELYFFFPFYHLGGAEKIHLQIAQIAKGKKAVIVFTRKSTNLGFLFSKGNCMVVFGEGKSENVFDSCHDVQNM